VPASQPNFVGGKGKKEADRNAGEMGCMRSLHQRKGRKFSKAALVVGTGGGEAMVAVAQSRVKQ